MEKIEKKYLQIGEYKECMFIKMPEGPEVRTIVDVLSEKMVGSTIWSISWDESSKFSSYLSSLPYLKYIFPASIDGVFCKGKQIFFKLTSIVYSKIFYINSTLGMEGKWYFQSGESYEKKQKHSNLWFNLYEKTLPDNSCKNIICIYPYKAYFDDTRHFGNFTLQSEYEFNEKWNSIGPDLLAEDIPLNVWTKAFLQKRRQHMQICVFLMNQNYFSGIGNYLKSEILYRCRILPDRTLGSLSDIDVSNLLKHSQETIRESYASKGLTIRSYWDPNGNKGTFKRVVYQKETDPFGNKVISGKFKDGRTSFFVPQLQK